MRSKSGAGQRYSPSRCGQPPRRRRVP
jgi:hypothetical protein